MTYGALGENLEIVAAKSAGISLQKMMIPLSLSVLALSVFAFYFSNNILPFTNLKAGSLLYDVRMQKPALYIQEGIFYNGLDGYSIKVGKKESDGQTLKNLMVYDHTSGSGNSKVMIAESGKMVMSEDEQFLYITLYNGNSYEEQYKKSGKPGSYPMLRSSFEEDVIRFDLSSFKLTRTDEELFKDNFRMLNLRQLNAAIDSFTAKIDSRKKDFAGILKSYFSILRDSVSESSKEPFFQKAPEGMQDPENIVTVLNNAMNQARSIKSYVQSTADELDSRTKSMLRFEIEWHRKFTLSAACLLLFLIGAPLGAIIRKGGLGIPVVISILFFLLYHIASLTGEKFARENVTSPTEGMWVSSLILLPIGIFLSYKATRDSSLFDIDAYLRIFRILKKRK
jgi:lipopolysaccharide export system permease protein